MRAVTQSYGDIGVARARVRARMLAEEQLRAEYAGTRESPQTARLIGLALLLTAAALVVIGAAG